MLLSIVIPFYNVEAYLPDCLGSVLPLPADQVELVLVDDRGQDGSAELARRLCQGRENVVFLRHPHNQGLSAARNTGLLAARGNILLFLDSDDALVTDAVLPLARLAAAQGLDILTGGFLSFDRDLPRTEVSPEPALQIQTGDAYLAETIGKGKFEPMVWQRLFRRDFLMENALRMEPGLLHEDELFTAPALLLARRAGVTAQPFYLYRQRPGSIMAGFARSAKWCPHYLHIAQGLLSISGQPPATPGKAALGRRAAAIALSLAKNIPAYGLRGEVKQAALAFLRTHRTDIAAITKRSPALSQRCQGRLLRFFPEGYVWAYGAARRLLRRGAAPTSD